MVIEGDIKDRTRGVDVWVNIVNIIKTEAESNIFYLARGEGMDIFYSYGCPSKRSEGDSVESEFNYPMERRVDWGVDWSVYDSDRFD